MPFASIMIFFSLYSFLGWAMETVYCSILAQKFVYRGFLLGPVCPIYGFGSLAVVLILWPFRGHPELIFLFGMIITSALEYSVSVLLEKLFKKSWWNYSDKKFNVNGRICLQNSILFGTLSLFLVYILHSSFLDIINRISVTVQLNTSGFLALIFCIDIIFSVRTVVNFNREMNKLSVLTETIENKREELKAALEAFRDEQKEKLEFELSGLISLQEDNMVSFIKKMHRILNAFPHMRLHRKDKLSLSDRLVSYRWKK